MSRIIECNQINFINKKIQYFIGQDDSVKIDQSIFPIYDLQQSHNDNLVIFNFFMSNKRQNTKGSSSQQMIIEQLQQNPYTLPQINQPIQEQLIIVEEDIDVCPQAEVPYQQNPYIQEHQCQQDHMRNGYDNLHLNKNQLFTHPRPHHNQAQIDSGDQHIQINNAPQTIFVFNQNAKTTENEDLGWKREYRIGCCCISTHRNSFCFDDYCIKGCCRDIQTHNLCCYCRTFDCVYCCVHHACRKCCFQKQFCECMLQCCRHMPLCLLIDCLEDCKACEGICQCLGKCSLGKICDCICGSMRCDQNCFGNICEIFCNLLCCFIFK